MLERIEELKQRVRETPLLERLAEARSRIGEMCSEGRPPRMCIPVQYDDDDFYISTTLSDAQDTIADLQGQVKAAQAERDEQGQLKARLNRDYNLLQNEHLKLHEKVKQEAAYTKQVEIERDALQQRVAQLEGENKALVDAHRDFKVHLSHCNFGEHAQVCKYGREETCPALTPSWVWFGNALQRSEALQADHARVLGLVQALPVAERKVRVKAEGIFRARLAAKMVGVGDEMALSGTPELIKLIADLLKYRASLPAQPAQGQGQGEEALIDRMAHINDGCKCRICKPKGRREHE